MRHPAPTPNLLAGAALAAGLTAAGLVAKGGDVLAPNTWLELVLLALAALALIAFALSRPARPHWGAGAVCAFAAFATLTALSVLWSVAPETSWIEAGRTLAYACAFTLAVILARLFPERWPAVAGAVALGATALAGYALLAKAVPGTFDAADTFGRLRVPFDYWNATGLIGALGVPACLWVGARADAPWWVRGLAVPAIAILITVTVLSYSRGALLIGALGVACWFALVPLRLRGAAVLGLGAAAGAVLSAYALGRHALTANDVALPDRVSAGHGFGVLLIALLVVATGAGLLCARTADRLELAPRRRRRIALLLLGLVALIPVAGVAALAESSRGLTGEVSHLVSTVTSTSGGAAAGPSRLVQLGNSRGRYWKEGVIVGAHALLGGVGAMGYETAVRARFNDALATPHAHSFLVQTFADLGLAGLAVALALFGAWLVAALRPLRPPPRTDAALEAERAGLLTLACVVVVFGLHSLIDWTWFVPGTALPALFAAGWLAGRGPLVAPRERLGRRSLTASPGVAAVALLVVAAAFALGWGVYAPLRSQNALDRSLAAAAAGDTGAALADARTAAGADPVAPEPLWQLAALHQALGDSAQARASLLQAIGRAPHDASSWEALGQFELSQHQARAALAAFERAAQLDRISAVARQGVAQAEQALAR